MKNRKTNEGIRWFEQSKRDIDDAIYAMKGERFNLSCFIAQQAAEKALKAFLYYCGAESVWGHSVAELCNDAGDFDKEFSQLGKTAGSLDKYYIPTRYPNGLPGGIPSDAFIREDAESALRIAEKVVEVVGGKVSAKESL